MPNEDNACIRYLMKEMDPSEEVLMERAMMEDDDLLIEVECMRQTLKKLDKLPRMNPPSHLTESIVKQAAEHRKSSRKSNSFYFFPGTKYAAAAVILISVAIGGLWMYEHTASDFAGSSGRTEYAEGDQGTAVSSGLFEVSKISEGKSQGENEDQPWIDRENILYFHDQFNADNADFDSILKSSTAKLKLLTDPFQANTGSRSLQMTGTGTNH